MTTVGNWYAQNGTDLAAKATLSQPLESALPLGWTPELICEEFLNSRSIPSSYPKFGTPEGASFRLSASVGGLFYGRGLRRQNG